MLFREENHSLLQIAGKQRLEGYIVVSKGKHWFNRWLGDYGHVSLLIRQGWFFVWHESTIGFSEVKLIPIGTKPSEFFTDSTEIHRFSCWRTINRLRNPWILAPFTCVEQVKSFIGLKNPLLLTPKQLLSAMKKRGMIDGCI